MQTKAQTKQQPATKGNKASNKPAPTSTAATLAALNGTPPVSSSAAQPVKKPPVVYSAGVAANAPANAPVVTIAGQAFNGALPATNPANRGAVGSVNAKLGTLTLGNGKQPKSAHGQLAWQVVVAALATANGKATAAVLATAAGHGGAAFVGYCVKNGWLAPSK